MAQIKAMMKKHLIFKKRQKGMYVMELLTPVYVGGIIYLILKG